MNRDRMRQTARALRESTSFNQNEWAHDCGAPACVAGHAAASALGKGERLTPGGRILNDANVAVGDIRGFAQDWLELGDHEADALFEACALGWPPVYKRRYNDAQTSQERAHVAADLLEALAAGEVTL